MDDNDIEWIHRYSQEMKLAKDQAFSLKELIESHRRLREINHERQQSWLEELQLARERGHREGVEWATTHDYISREKLKAMTLLEIANWLEE